LVAGLLLAGCLLTLIPSPVFALDGASYFSITYTTVLNEPEIHSGDTVTAVVTGKAVCTKNLPLAVSEGYVKGKLRARNEVTGNTIDLGSEYTVTISPFPNKQGDSSQQSVSLSLSFPPGVQPGQYVVYGELLEARVRAILWFTVTSYLPSTQDLTEVSVLPVVSPVIPPVITPTVPAVWPGTTSIIGHTDAQGVITNEMSAVSEDGNCAVSLAKGVKVLDRDGFPLGEIRIIPLENPPAFPSGTNLIGLAYSLTPEGATFRPGITLSIKYDPTKLTNGATEEDIIIVWWDPATSAWVKIEGGALDKNRHTISTAISHFSFYAVIVQNPLAPSPDSGQNALPALAAKTEESVTTTIISNVNLPALTISPSTPLTKNTVFVTINNSPTADINQTTNAETHSPQWWLIGLIFGINILLLIMVLRLLRKPKTRV